jgi:hypothetical protein
LSLWSLQPSNTNTSTEKGELSRHAEKTHYKGIDADITPRKKPSVRRNCGRMDGVQWNGSSFICHAHVDDTRTTADAMNAYDWDDEEPFYQDQVTPEEHRVDEMTISLLDIARPAKPKFKGQSRFMFSYSRTVFLDSMDGL